ncbi:MAG: O-antigen ligase family protein [Candidatus Omnitrophica bacterium]|jgi:O-antigen ligase|nr:O-antigen ligase family protein [Candidatus Omnitrophota bacterium]MDD5080126.1 O-antigen ligase family protein [Candidatus Omnitrophota bacterium]
MFICLLILIFLRPFIASAAFPDLNNAYSIILLICLLACLIRDKPSEKTMRGLKLPIALSCAFLAVAALVPGCKITPFSELSGFLAGIMIFIAASSWDEEKRNAALRLVVFSGFIISLLAVYQYFFGFGHTEKFIDQSNLSYDFARDYMRSRRVFFPFITPNAMAGYLAMLIPLTLADRSRRWLILPLSLAFLLSRSVGAFFSIFAGLSLYFIAGKKINRRRLIILCGALLFACLIFAWRAGSGQKHNQPAFSTMMRLEYWSDTLELIRSHPILGVGPGNFNLAGSRYSHNSYLQLWAETGLIGLGCFLWLAGAVLVSGIKNLRKAGFSVQTGLLLISVTAFLAHNLMDFTFFLPEVSLLWWLILGMFYSCSRPALPARAAGRKTTPAIPGKDNA